MKQHAINTQGVEGRATENGYDTVLVPGSKPGVFYTVDVTFGRCSCPAWKFQHGTTRKPCKHLRALGFTEPVEMEVAEPQKAQKQTVKVKEQS